MDNKLQADARCLELVEKALRALATKDRASTRILDSDPAQEESASDPEEKIARELGIANSFTKTVVVNGA